MKYPIEAWEEAANFRDAKAVDEMLRDLEPGDLDGDGVTTPLHVAARDGYYFAVSRLVDAGADVAATDEDGNTPLEVAMAEDAPAEVVDFLVGAGSGFGDTDLNDIEAELVDGGFEPESDSYLVEMRLSRPSVTAYTIATESAVAPLCESRLDTSGGQIFELRVNGARSFKEAVEVLESEFGFEIPDDDWDGEEPLDDLEVYGDGKCATCGAPVADSGPAASRGLCDDCFEKMYRIEDEPGRCTRCGMEISEEEAAENDGLCSWCAQGDFGPVEETKCSECGKVLETAEYGTYGGKCCECAVADVRR